MSLTRKYLKALDIDETKIDQIIEQHIETLDSVKTERDEYKEKAEAAAEVQKKLDAMTKERDKLQIKLDDDASYKAKYDAEHQAFEDYKKGVDADKVKTSKVNAYKALLKKAGVKDTDNGKRYNDIVRITDFDAIELDDNGNIKDADNVVENIKSEWSGFIATTKQTGADTETPPANNHGDKKMTIEEIDAIKDTAARQKAMAENHELYGI